MKKLLLSLYIIMLIYLVVIIVPAGLYYTLPRDGLIEDVERMFEQRDRVISQWSPLTGIWCADWSR